MCRCQAGGWLLGRKQVCGASCRAAISGRPGRPEALGQLAGRCVGSERARLGGCRAQIGRSPLRFAVDG
eukprot:9905439-Alexandrium_andersonii.AAC.1